MAQDHALAGKVAGRSAAASSTPVAQEDKETPKGTLFIMFLFGASIVLLWGYMYLNMILRR